MQIKHEKKGGLADKQRTPRAPRTRPLTAEQKIVPNKRAQESSASTSLKPEDAAKKVVEKVEQDSKKSNLGESSKASDIKKSKQAMDKKKKK